MNDQQRIILGIDLGTTYSCIAYVDPSGKTNVIPNQEHQLTTPSVVLFEKEARIVGEEAKSSAILNPDRVVEMVKRHMGEADWSFHYDGQDYSAEEIASYILRKIVTDAQKKLDVPIKDVVITCPAHFGIAQREATVRAGEIAGLRVHEVINEPTASALAYGLQYKNEQIVLVYDLGGGTFDIAVIAVHKNATTVIATGGDYHLGGRDWDEAIVTYLAQQWQEQTKIAEDPLESPDTLQDLWLKAEKAKCTLTAREQTNIAVAHNGRTVKVELTRTKFDELTSGLLDRTILFTKLAMEAAQKKGYTHYDQIVLVGGSTRMPQISERLNHAFNIPLRLFEPEEAVAKGAALYGQHLLLQEHVYSKLDEMRQVTQKVVAISKNTANLAKQKSKKSAWPKQATVPMPLLQQARNALSRAFNIENGNTNKPELPLITNVASHSFGIIAIMHLGTEQSRRVISNLVRVNDSLPAIQIKKYGIIEDNQEKVVIEIMENSEETLIVEQDKFTDENEIGTITLNLPANLPKGAPIEVKFEMNMQGRLHVTGREPASNRSIDVILETKGALTKSELQQAKERAQKIEIL